MVDSQNNVPGIGGRAFTARCEHETALDVGDGVKIYMSNFTSASPGNVIIEIESYVAFEFMGIV